MRPIYKNCPLFKLKTIDELLTVLNGNRYKIDLQELEALCRQIDLYKEQVVTVDDLTGKRRLCEIPTAALKQFQERIHKILHSWLKEQQPQYLFSFRSPLQNARYHSTELTTVRYDVHRFFRNTRTEKIYCFFKERLRMTVTLARLLTGLCTYKGHLPTGAPTSPILSFLAYRSMWEEIDTHCKRWDYRFSLYIDDLVISGTPLQRDKLRIVKYILHRYGFSIAKGKTKWFAENRPKYITGIIVCFSGPYGRDSRFYAPHSTHKRLNERRKQLAKAQNRKERKLRKKQIEGLEQWLQQIQAVNHTQTQV